MLGQLSVCLQKMKTGSLAPYPTAFKVFQPRLIITRVYTIKAWQSIPPIKIIILTFLSYKKDRLFFEHWVITKNKVPQQHKSKINNNLKI